MEEKKVKLVIGSLLHDIGKVLYRYNDGRNHSLSGYEYLKNQIGIDEKEILEQVQYHHAVYLKNAKIENNSLAYVTYIADNIASGVDRRKNEDDSYGFSQELPLESIFNLLNNNEQKMVYQPQQLNETINYPTSKSVHYEKEFYGKLVNHLETNLCSIDYTEEYLNSLLEILETEFTYIPSSTAKSEVSDISLYDHVKLTAAFASCIEAYLTEQKITDYKECLFRQTEEFYKKKVFLLYSMDISGIQDFIYTIISEDALKSLRSRSFYLEFLMENLIDEVVKSVGVSRTNIIYSGGGHAYFILPNTEQTKAQLKKFEDKTNAWLVEHFKTSLYLGCGYAECSAMDLRNEPEGSYRNIFKMVSSMISQNKAHRYSASQFISLNKDSQNHLRECKVCRSTDRLTEENICSICDGLIQMSRRILHQKLFAVTERKDIKPSLPLPFGKYMIAENENKILEMLKKKEIIRMYTKNEAYTGSTIAKRLWIGDYTNGETFEELAASSQGINRIAVLRADVDNLGNAFVNGFSHKKYGEKYMTISRTATFSRKMSIFFKYHINALLKEGHYYIGTKKEQTKRDITIVYSGGDDVFIVGSWDEVIGFAVDMTESFREFTQNTLTLSAGIGIYPNKYPISAIAREVGELEEAAKGYPNKNAVALFDEDLVFSWAELKENVLEEKLVFIKQFFDEVPNKGRSFLYKLLELIRNLDETEGKINLARLAYLMARLEESVSQKGNMQNLSRKVYEWAKVPKERKALIAAIYIYVYLMRVNE